MEYNIYCDESCHLEFDNINVMVLGAVWCPFAKVKEVVGRIKETKEKYNVAPKMEIKWTKVSPVKYDLYKNIIDYFFDDDDLHFRCLVIPDKSILDHKSYAQTHDDWYYKMYFDMLKVIFTPDDNYNIYIDVKDTYSHRKAQDLHNVCCNNAYDFSSKIIRKIQPIRSHESQILQLADILIGAVAYHNRIFPDSFAKSQAKLDLIQRIIKRSNYSLTQSTLYREDKFNILMWESNNRRV